MLLFLLTLFAPQNVTSEHVDLVELNSHYDCIGSFVYDQVIFYEWAPDQSVYHVRAWVLSDGDRDPQRDYRTGLWVTKYTDRDSSLSRTITATHYRRSWTQVDPERENKRLLREEDRHGLIKRVVKPIPDDTPMAEDWSGE